MAFARSPLPLCWLRGATTSREEEGKLPDLPPPIISQASQSMDWFSNCEGLWSMCPHKPQSRMNLCFPGSCPFLAIVTHCSLPPIRFSVWSIWGEFCWCATPWFVQTEECLSVIWHVEAAVLELAMIEVYMSSFSCKLERTLETACSSDKTPFSFMMKIHSCGLQRNKGHLWNSFFKFAASIALNPEGLGILTQKLQLNNDL